MSHLPKPSRVAVAGGQQDRQKDFTKIENVPAHYRNYPNFDALLEDPAHYGDANGKVIREAMTAVEAEMSHFIKGPVTRPESPYIDFYDGDGNPFDVKTPLSPSKGDKWEFSAWQNADTILEQLDKDHKNKKTGEKQPVAVLLDTTYMTQNDKDDLWRELRARTKEDRSILNRVFEVNVYLDKRPQEKSRLNPVQIAAMKQRLGR